jgi:hypothetical protein
MSTATLNVTAVPRPPERAPGLLVYLAGVGTTALTVLLVQALPPDFNVLGFYVNGIFPVGALAVGAVSGLGYALGSRVLNVKLSKGFVLGMLTTGVADWFALQYFEYAELLERFHASSDAFSFIDFLTRSATSMTFSRAGSSHGLELGAAGYLFKALELAGFAVGTMAPSAMLMTMPYCRGCRRYLAKERTGVLASTATRDEVMKLNRFQLRSAERAAALEAAREDVLQRTNEVWAQLASAPLGDVRRHLEALGATAPKDKPAALVEVNLKACPSCDSHHLSATLSTFSADGKPASSEVLTLDKPATIGR